MTEDDTFRALSRMTYEDAHAVWTTPPFPPRERHKEFAEKTGWTWGEIVIETYERTRDGLKQRFNVYRR